MVHRPNEVRREDEASLQDRNHEKIGGIARGNRLGDGLDARGDIGFGKQHPDAVPVDLYLTHGEAFEPISSGRANRISTVLAASGGEATRVTKLFASPGLKGRDAVSSCH